MLPGKAWSPLRGSPQAAPRFPSLPSMHTAPLPQGSRGGGLLYPQISALPKTFSNSFEQRVVSGEIIVTLQTGFLKKDSESGQKGLYVPSLVPGAHEATSFCDKRTPGRSGSDPACSHTGLRRRCFSAHMTPLWQGTHSGGPSARSLERDRARFKFCPSPLQLACEGQDNSPP